MNKNILKVIFILCSILFSSCSSVEQRIKEYSYTQDWYYFNNFRYQVYQTKAGNQYIIVLNRRETDFKRLYIKNKTKKIKNKWE